MNLIKFASLMAATGGGKDPDPSADPLQCLNEGMDAMCCLHDGAVGGPGIEGCVTCMMKALEDYDEEPTCDELKVGNFCSLMKDCFKADGACNNECADKLQIFGKCTEAECPDLCELGFALPLTIA
mmetsp:Transcript_21312/g.39147  ORF Transcript_21312/g.39147 Transcript_21312/m.39147 type:complete len:126 (+) Transcript_21312:555-932(+)